MITVSDAWKKAHTQRLLPETFVEITMDMIDRATSERGYASCENEATFSNSGSVVNNQDYDATEKYAFLEQNLWVLDGSRDIISDISEYHPPAYVSSDDSEAVVTVIMDSVQSTAIPGLTIHWSNEFSSYATSFSVEVKNGNTVVASTTVTDNTSVVSIVDMPFSNFDSIVIRVLDWSMPDCRRRIDAVYLGLSLIFSKNEIISYTHEQSGSPLGTELSKNSIEFSVDNSDGRWNLLNPTGLGKYLYERQKLTVRYGMEIDGAVEWVKAGVFYLSEWRTPVNGIEATFVARDMLEFMMNATYSRSHTNGVINAKANVYLTKEDCIFYFSDDNVSTTLEAGTAVRVYEKSVWYSDGYGDSPSDPGIMCCRIDQGWIRFDYVTITSDTRLRVDFDNVKDHLPSDAMIYHSDEITGVSAPMVIPEMNAAEFLQQCVAAYGVNVWQKADGVLYFMSPDPTLSDYRITADVSYLHPEVELSKPLRRVNMVQHYMFREDTTNIVFEVGNTGEDITVDCDYVWYTDNRTAYLASKYIVWWKHREVVSGEFRADPRLELFDVVTVESKYGVISPVMITYIKYTYNGSFHGAYEGKVIADAAEVAALEVT